MRRTVHQFLCLLIAIAIVGGTTSQLARAAQSPAPVAVAGMPCDMAMPAADIAQDKPMMPCKEMTPDCIKQLGCVVAVGLPARFVSVEPASHGAVVTYWSAWSDLTSFVATPEPLPPRTT